MSVLESQNLPSTVCGKKLITNKNKVPHTTTCKAATVLTAYMVVSGTHFITISFSLKNFKKKKKKEPFKQSSASPKN